MKNWGRRIRAAFVMGLTWGAAWSVAAVIVARVPGVNSDLPLAFLFAPLGFVTGVVFSGILVGLGGSRGIERTSLSRFAGWGAVSGLLLTGIFVAAAALRGGSPYPWGEFLLFGPALTVASAACAAGSLALARRANRRGLTGPRGESTESALTENEGRSFLGRGE